MQWSRSARESGEKARNPRAGVGSARVEKGTLSLVRNRSWFLALWNQRRLRSLALDFGLVVANFGFRLYQFGFSTLGGRTVDFDLTQFARRKLRFLATFFPRRGNTESKLKLYSEEHQLLCFSLRISIAKVDDFIVYLFLQCKVLLTFKKNMCTITNRYVS